MSESVCASPTLLPQLLSYWLGEMDEVSQAGLEEHFFSCVPCAERLARLVHLTNAIRDEIREGRLSSVLPAAFIRRLKDAGVRVREYRMHAGGSVNCTVAPEDDMVVAHLHAQLGDVSRLDVIVDEGGGRVPYRLSDVAFDPRSDEVVVAPSIVELRKLGVATQRVDLIAVGDDAERVIGSYTFNHSPYQRPSA